MREKFALLLSLFLLQGFLIFSPVLFAEPLIEVIYLIPSDQVQDEEKLDVLSKMVADVQTFYADEMERHGFERKTFEYNENIRVHNGQHTLKAYLADRNLIWFELGRVTWLPETLVDIVFMEGTDTLAGNSAGKVLSLLWGAGKQGVAHGYALIWIPVKVTEFMTPVLAHELGHVFGLDHRSALLTNGKRTVMQAGASRIRDIEKYAISLEEAKILDKSVFLSIQEKSDVLSETDADVNDDGYIDLYDVMIVRSATKSPTSYDTDVNDDGVTDEIDVMLVKAAAFQAIAAVSPSKHKFKLTTTWAELKRK